MDQPESQDLLHFSAPLLHPGWVRYSDDIEAILARLDSDEARSASCFVYKLSDRTFQQLVGGDSASLLKRIEKRAKGKPVYVLTYNVTSKLHQLFQLTSTALVPAIVSKEIFHKFCGTELSALLNTNGASRLISAPFGVHLETPSGLHCTQFLRVANLFQSIEVIDTFSYWLLPHLASAGGVITDNWNICPPVLRAMATNLTPPMPFDFFGQHVSIDKTVARNIIDRMLGDINPRAQILCLLSVNGGGYFARILRELFQDLGAIPAFKPLALYRFADSSTEVEALCSLEQAAGYSTVEDCAPCGKNDPYIKIDSSLYYLREQNEREVVLKQTTFAHAYDFFRRHIAAQDAIALHRDDPNDSRHHAFYIDVAKLLASKAFSLQLLEHVTRLKDRNVDLIVTPNHHACNLLGDIAKKILDAPVLVHNDLRTDLLEADIQLLKQSKSLLILDDQLITGSRFNQYTTALRELKELYGGFEAVTYLAALARPTSDQHLRQCEISLTKHAPWKASFLYVDKLLLPNWKAAECPWCQEYDLLRALSHSEAAIPAWMAARLQCLTRRDAGLSDPALLSVDGSALPVLGDGSIVGPMSLNSAQVAVAVASGVQSARTCSDESQRLAPSLLTPGLLSEKSLKNLSEGLLRAALLRVTKATEWGSKMGKQSQDYLFGEIGNQGQEIIVPELLLAIHRGALPVVAPSRIIAAAGVNWHKQWEILLGSK